MSTEERPLAFISYAREDQEFVEDKLVPLCESQGYAPWRDKVISGGDDFEQRIVEQLRNSDLFLLVMSPHSQASHWVRDELHVALHLCVPVIPLMYAYCDALAFHIRLPRLQSLNVQESVEPLREHLERNATAYQEGTHGEPRDLTTEFAAVAITLLPWQRLNHLRNLYNQTAEQYRGGRTVRHEIRYLCDLGLLRRKPDRRIAELEGEAVVNLADITELTEIGRELAKYIR